jgi:hypothetical protein
MISVRHRGVVIAVQHPAVWIDKGPQIVRDLIDVFTHPSISPDCLRHLLAQRQRLVRGVYYREDGRGCLMHILTEPLAPRRRIRSKQDLIRLFGRPHGSPGAIGYVAPQDSPEYQPAKWLVRLVDRQISPRVRTRYGRSAEFFDYELVLEVAQQVIDQTREPVDRRDDTPTAARRASLIRPVIRPAMSFAKMGT